MRKALISLLLLASVLCCWSGIAVAGEAEPTSEVQEAAALTEDSANSECLFDEAENSNSAGGEDAVQDDAIQPDEQVSAPESDNSASSPSESAKPVEKVTDAGGISSELASEPTGVIPTAEAGDTGSKANPEIDQLAEETPAAPVAAPSASPKRAEAASQTVTEKTSLAQAKITASKRKLYNGKRIKPKVKVVLGGKKLVLNRDYKVVYKNNKSVGKATIVIKGIGAYTGRITQKFKIVSKMYIAVPDRSPNAASGLTRYLRSLGFNCAWVNSAKIDPDKYDGLAIPGDPSDVDPRFYGEKNRHAHTPRPQIEKMQFKLIKKFAKANKPVLGICKGCQIINVAYGGSLHQDLGGYHRLWQTTHIKKGSWLRKKLDATVSVYHYHHQAVKRLAENFKVMAWSMKGNRKIIEGIEHRTLPVWGIQFHPENSGRYASIIGNMYKREVAKRM